MIIRYRTLTALVSVPLLGAASALAGPINFDDNAITFTKPSVTHGDGATATIVPNAPQLMKLADGLSVVNFSYTATIASIPQGSQFGLVYIDWSAARMGTLAQKTDILLKTSGNTDITANSGSVNFSIFGALDSGSPKGPSGSLLFATSLDAPLKNKPVKWSESNTWESVAAGNRTLTLTSEARWSGVVVGDKLTVSSLYILEAVPEPSALLLACVGLSGVAMVRRAYRPGPRASVLNS